VVTVTLEAVGVTLGRRPVVRDVSAILGSGTLVGIIGPNGAGKSSLVRAMLGLIPATGRVLIDGREVKGLPARSVARALAYLPQGATLHWPLTVERLVALGRLPHLAPFSRLSQVDHAAIGAALTRAAALHLRDRPATELSGGERARVMLARALAVGAEGLVADEPLAALDPGHQIDMMEVLTAEARAGALVVAVLHDLTMAARYCDRLLLLDEGRLVADGPPAAILTPGRLRAVYGIEARMESLDGQLSLMTRGRART
jgi:iron complex transport system ATP-binding protein